MSKIMMNGQHLYRKKVSESITLRFDKAILDELRSESELNMESVNTLLNRILKSYIKWHMPAILAGMCHVNKFLYSDIVEQLSDETLNRIIDNFAQHHFVDTIEIFREKSSISHYVDYLLTWLKISGFNYRIDEDDANQIVIKIQFDMGLKFSKYISTKIKIILQTLRQTGVWVKYSDHMVMVGIPSSS